MKAPANPAADSIPDDLVAESSNRENLDVDSETVFKRRQIIWKQVSRNGKLSYSDLKKEVKLNMQLKSPTYVYF